MAEQVKEKLERIQLIAWHHYEYAGAGFNSSDFARQFKRIARLAEEIQRDLEGQVDTPGE